jgi:hypothetical protein
MPVMELKDLKKNDLIEYSYLKIKGQPPAVERNVIQVTISKDTVVFGGMFSFDFRDMKILKVWREDPLQSGVYAMIYDACEKGDNNG